MSSTRHAETNAPLSQNRYMSSPEYAELRGLSGNAVAAKAGYLRHPRKRSLLFFLQALSLARSGGLKYVVDDLLSMFPERLGSPTMHKVGTKPTTIYNADQVRRIRDELHLATSQFPLRGENLAPDPETLGLDKTVMCESDDGDWRWTKDG